MEQFLLFSTIFSILILDVYVKTGIRFSLRDKRLFEITEVEITRVDCTLHSNDLPKSACLKQVLAKYRSISMQLPVFLELYTSLLNTGYLLNIRGHKFY